MTALQNRREAKGRHPLLKVGTLAQRIFNHLKWTPGATIAEIAKSLHEQNQSVNGMLQRMKREGLILTQHVQRGSRVVTGYFTVRENEGGYARDKVTIETVICVNEYGEYLAKSKVVGEHPFAHDCGYTAIHIVTYEAAVPKPSEPYKTRVPFAHSDMGEGLVIDGEIVDIKE